MSLPLLVCAALGYHVAAPASLVCAVTPAACVDDAITGPVLHQAASQYLHDLRGVHITPSS